MADNPLPLRERVTELAAEVERLQGERDEYAEVLQKVSDDRESRLKAARRDVTNVCKAATEYRRERDALAARLAASERQRQALVERAEAADVLLDVGRRYAAASDAMYESKSFDSADEVIALWKEFRAALAAAATPEGDAGLHEFMPCQPGSCALPHPLPSPEEPGCHWPYGNVFFGGIKPYRQGDPICVLTEAQHRAASPAGREYRPAAASTERGDGE